MANVKHAAGPGRHEAQAAEAMGTTQAVIARLEGGRVKPSTRTLERLAKATAPGSASSSSPIAGEGDPARGQRPLPETATLVAGIPFLLWPLPPLDVLDRGFRPARHQSCRIPTCAKPGPPDGQYSGFFNTSLPGSSLKEYAKTSDSIVCR